MARSGHLWNGQTCGVIPVRSGEFKVVQDGRNEGYPIWTRGVTVNMSMIKGWLREVSQVAPAVYQAARTQTAVHCWRLLQWALKGQIYIYI